MIHTDSARTLHVNALRQFAIGELVLPMPNPVGWAMCSEPSIRSMNYDLVWSRNADMAGIVLEILDSTCLTFYKVATSHGQVGWLISCSMTKSK